MFQSFRNQKRWLMLIAMILIIPAFVFIGINGYSRLNPDANAIAKVDGKGIQPEEFDYQKREYIERMRQQEGGAVDPSIFETQEANAAILQNIATRRALQAQMAHHYMNVSEADAINVIKNADAFKKDGQFSPELYENYLAARGKSDQQFVYELRRDLVQDMLVNSVAQTTFVPKKTVALLNDILRETRVVRTMSFDPSSYMKDVKVSEEQIKKYYDEHKDDYRAPESLNIQFVVMSPETVKMTAEPSEQELKDFYQMMPEKFNNKTNGITQRRFLLHGNPLLADWVTDHIGDGWITDLSQMSKLKPLADDPKARAEFMDIKYKNKERLAKYILEHNGVEIDPRSIYDVQVKRLHEYKRQLLNILHVMYLYNQIKEHPEMSFYPRTFIFGAKASAGYVRAKEIIKLINSVADVVNNDLSINGKLKVVFIEDYRVSNAEWIFAAADVSEQISTASKEASGTGNMKFMLNGAPTLGTMDGANVEIVEEVGIENAFIFGLSSDEVINYENNGGYNPQEIYFNDWDIKRVVDQLMDGTYSHGDHEMFRDLYNSLLNTQGGDRPDRYFILKDFRSYAEAQKKVEEAYKDPDRWAKMALLNTASCGKFTSDRTIQEYVDNIWKLDYVTVKPEA